MCSRIVTPPFVPGAAAAGAAGLAASVGLTAAAGLVVAAGLVGSAATGFVGAAGAAVGLGGAPQAARAAVPLASKPHFSSPRRVIAIALSPRARFESTQAWPGSRQGRFLG